MKNQNVVPSGDQTDAMASVVAELDSIKRLLILLLMKGGSSGREIAKALGVHESTVSRQFRLGDVEPFETRTSDGEKV